MEEFTSLRWFKSSHSGGGGCVEVAHMPGGGIALRDTKDAGKRDPLVFDRAEWAAFLKGAHAGEFDLPA
jgi:uncharacterized protein DUF397